MDDPPDDAKRTHSFREVAEELRELQKNLKDI